MKNFRFFPAHSFPVFLGMLTLVLFSTRAHSEFLLLGDDRLFYDETGSGYAVFLASGGSGMDHRQWDRILPDLSETFRVIRFDPRGIGRSDNPTARYSDSADLDALFRHLVIDQACVIGLSSAGGFALTFATDYPERNRGLVAIAPFVPGFEFSDEMLARLTRFNDAAESGRDRFLDEMFNDPHFIPAPLNRSIRQIARKNMAFNFDKGDGFDPSLPIAVTPPLIERLREISVSTLLLAGELDHPEVLRRNKFLMSQIEEAQEYVIKDAGHNAPLENPAGVLSFVRPFLEATCRYD